MNLLKVFFALNEYDHYFIRFSMSLLSYSYRSREVGFNVATLSAGKVSEGASLILS